jgi:hypothetical protein
MAEYTATIRSSLPPGEAFSYMARFGNVREWDPSVVEAEPVGTGEPRLGSAFRLVTRVRGREVPLRYEITAFDPDRRVVLEAINPRFRSVDTVTVAPEGSGSTVTYHARLVPRGVMRLAEPFLAITFARLARAAERGLRARLGEAPDRVSP